MSNDVTLAGSAQDVPGSSQHVRGALSFLAGDWVNERLFNVADKADEILERIIDFGLLSSGFAPFETPITTDMLLRMTPDQFRAFYDTIPSIEEKAAVLATYKKLKMPLKEILPKEQPTPSPAPQPKLSFGPLDTEPEVQ